MGKVDEYIAGAPADQQPTLKMLRGMIRKAFPKATEEMSPHNFAVYTSDGEWLAGFATRTKCAKLYVMLQEVLDEYEDRLGKLRTGRSCIDFRKTRTISLDELTELSAQILARAAKKAGER